VPIRPIGTETIGVSAHDARPVPGRQRRAKRFRDVAPSVMEASGARRVYPWRLLGTFELSTAQRNSRVREGNFVLTLVAAQNQNNHVEWCG